MQYRSPGRTGVSVSAVGLGVMLFGGATGADEADGARLDRCRDGDWDVKHFVPGPDAVVDAVARVAGAHGATPAQLSLAWLLTRPGVSSVVLGARTAGQLREQLGALSLDLSTEDLTRLDEVAPPGRAVVPHYLDHSFADFRPHEHRW